MTDQHPTTIQHDGVEYLAGIAGSLILSCRACGRDSFREAMIALAPDYIETCLGCGAVKEPVRVVDMETVWKPIWSKDDAA